MSSCGSSKVDYDELRLGYLLNMTHAIPIVGLETGKFTNVKGSHFLAGGHLVNALITGNIDLGYIGPGPFINANSKGIKLIVLSGASEGGNSYIISKELAEANPNILEENLTEYVKKVAVPQFGNTQDLLARKYLNPSLTYIAVNPAEVETTFFTKAVDAAVVPEPWGTILEAKGAIKIEDLSAEMNKYSAAMLVIDQDFYDEHRIEVDEFILEHEEVMDFVRDNPGKTAKIASKHLRKIFKRDIKEDFLKESLEKITFEKYADRKLLQDLVKTSQDLKYIRKPVDMTDRVRISETNWEL